jgi:hypothetical protein
MQMREGHLPVRYLGVPLISSKLSARDCRVLIEKIAGRIDSWTSKNLSFAGRLQLLSSILYSIQVYWSRIFILPKKIIKDISQKFNHFLGNGKRGVLQRLKCLGLKFVSLKRRVAWGLRSWKFGIFLP